MSDTLTITALEIRAHIGVTAEERATEQKLLVNVDIELDSRRAGGSDDVKDTINYSTIAASIKELAMQPRKTIENLAECIAATVMEHPAVKAVVVKVTKFPKIGAECVSLTIHREK